MNVSASLTSTRQSRLYFMLWTGLSLSLYDLHRLRLRHLAFVRTPVSAGARQGWDASVLVFVNVRLLR